MSDSKSVPRTFLLVGILVAPVILGMLLYSMDEFDAAALPEDGLSRDMIVVVEKRYNKVLSVMERIGDGRLAGPEDLVYDEQEGVVYASCMDGWVKRVQLGKLVRVEDWVNVGGRPLGLAFGPDNQLVVAESVQGLLKISKDGEVKLLTDEADGLKFKLTDGVDVARNGVIYFTDASYKYNLKSHMLDLLEGRPYGRLLSYDPWTNQTKVLVKDLYFANGVALSPQQDFVIFCETVMRRCRKYYIEGERKGEVDNFIEGLPGYPDNIHYDGEGRYWIALATGKTFFWDSLMRYPWIRKTCAILARFVTMPHMQRDGGIMAVNLDGDVIALYTDPGLAMVTSGIKIGNHLYYGSLVNPYISRIDIAKLGFPV